MMSRWQKKSLKDLGISAGCGDTLRHVVLHAEEIWTQCVVRGATIADTARRLGVGPRAVGGLRAAMTQLRGVPAPERLAAIVYTDAGWTVPEVAELFGRSDRWAQIVYDKQQEIRNEYPIAPRYERAAAGMLMGDPDLETLWAKAAEVRKVAVSRVAQINKGRKRPNIRHYTGGVHNGSLIFRCAG
jgi:hypothetical protein